MDIVVLGIDLGKNVCSVVGLGAAGQFGSAKNEAGVGCRVYAKMALVCGSDGSVLRCASLGTPVGSARALRASHIARICASLRQGTEER